jgi:hypothetical protein
MGVSLPDVEPPATQLSTGSIPEKTTAAGRVKGGSGAPLPCCWPESPYWVMRVRGAGVYGDTDVR